MPKSWSGRPREIEIRPVVNKGIPIVVIGYALCALISLTVTIGCVAFCFAHPAKEGYSVPSNDPNSRPLQTPNGH